MGHISSDKPRFGRTEYTGYAFFRFTSGGREREISSMWGDLNAIDYHFEQTDAKVWDKFDYCIIEDRP